MFVKTIDGTPDAVKVACPVWNGGKPGDDFKGLPIIIERKAPVFSIDRIYPLRGTGGGAEFCYAPGNAECNGSPRG